MSEVKTKPSLIVLEELNVTGTAGNRRLSRLISDAGKGEFRRQIEYRAARNGIRVMTAPLFAPISNFWQKTLQRFFRNSGWGSPDYPRSGVFLADRQHPVKYPAC